MGHAHAEPQEIRTVLNEAVAGGSRGVPAAERLCHAVVDLLDIDGAALSLISGSDSLGTFAASGEFSRTVDMLQFDLGEGPCWESVSGTRPILVDDLASDLAHRWPAFAQAALGRGVHAIFALPISVTQCYVGALDLFRNAPGPLANIELVGGLLAAELAALPLLDMLGQVNATIDDNVDHAAWSELAGLDRVEIYQATGMLMGQLDVSATEALVRLRAHAFASERAVHEVAWDVIEHRLQMDAR